MVDPEALRTWLTAPVPGPARHSVVDWIDPDADLAHTAHLPTVLVDRLLAMAQHVGVFGLAGKSIELQHARPTQANPHGLLLAVRDLQGYVQVSQVGNPLQMQMEYGPARPFATISVGALLAGEGYGVDLAVGLLTGIGEAINAALDARPRNEPGHTRQRQTGPFPRLPNIEDNGPPPPPSTPDLPRRSR